MRSYLLIAASAAAAAASATLPPHPRLIFTDERMANISSAMKSDPTAQAMYAALEAHANAILPEPPVARPASSYSGILLAAREVLDRLYSLTLVARLTGKQEYCDRAVEEMLNCTAWSDWNGKAHFLDTAELMHAVGAAYDGLFHCISPANRSRIAAGLASKGLEAFSEDHSTGWWWKTVFNWGGVCNGGAIVAALALADDPNQGPLAQEVLGLGLEGIPFSMAGYGPDGMWPEGPIYEDYMTRYVVAAVTALQGAGMDGNASSLIHTPGFDHTCLFTVYEQGAGSQWFFDWSDSDPEARSHPNLLWLGTVFNQPACAAIGRLQASRSVPSLKAHGVGSNVNAVARNLLYFTPIGTLDDVAQLPLDKVYTSATIKPLSVPPEKASAGAPAAPALVALFHASLNFSDLAHEEAHFLGFKAGINGINHGHLDAGSFVYDYSALRFAGDLGSGWYGLPDYFGNKRWDYYRTNSSGHNVLKIGGQNQQVPANSYIVAHAENSDPLASKGSWAVADLSAAYEGAGMQAVSRGVALLGGMQAIIVDNLQAASTTTTPRTAMTTTSTSTSTSTSAKRGTSDGDEASEVVWQLHSPVTNTTGPFTDEATGDTFYSLHGVIGSGRIVQTYLRIVGAGTDCPGLSGAQPFTPNLQAPQVPLTGVVKVELTAPDKATCKRIVTTLGPAPPSAALNINPDLATWPKSGPVSV